MIGTTVLSLTGSGFDLSWTHSVERTEWRESWAIGTDSLRLTEAAVKGSGAGMDPGEGARLEDGWWVWTPDLPPVPALILAASGATGAGWRLCDATSCHEIGAKPGTALELAPCPG
jgi:hypothetical protein